MWLQEVGLAVSSPWHIHHSGEISKDILDDVLASVSSFQQSSKLLHIRVAQIDMSSEDHALLGCGHLRCASIGVVEPAMAVEHNDPLIVDLKDREACFISAATCRPACSSPTSIAQFGVEVHELESRQASWR